MAKSGFFSLGSPVNVSKMPPRGTVPARESGAPTIWYLSFESSHVLHHRPHTKLQDYKELRSKLGDIPSTDDFENVTALGDGIGKP